MLYRKIESAIKRNLENPDSKVLVVSGARQIGKSYIVRHTASRLFKNLIEINLIEISKVHEFFKMSVPLMISISR